jgi:hypothetical protein
VSTPNIKETLRCLKCFQSDREILLMDSFNDTHKICPIDGGKHKMITVLEFKEHKIME